MKIGDINTQDISIVVQGPIVKNKDYYSNGWTNEALKRLRTHFPDAEIILSTWKGADVEGLTFDVLVENDDPGQTYYNLNRQIVSAKNGLDRVTRKYAMKWRTDTILKSNRFIEYFYRFPVKDKSYSVFKERVILPTARDPRFSLTPFAYSDYYHFGLSEDIKAIWSIPLAPKEWMTWFANRDRPTLTYEDARYTPEQYIWITFLKQRLNIECEHSYDWDKRKIEQHEKIAASNFILVDLKMGHIEWIRFPGDKERGSLSPHRFFLKQKFDNWFQFSLTYDYKIWKRLYETHCLKKESFSGFFRYHISSPAKANFLFGIKKFKQSIYETRKVR